MSGHFTALRLQLIQLSEPVRELLSKSNYTPTPANPNVSIKSLLLSLFPPLQRSAVPLSTVSSLRAEIRDFALCCAAIRSSSSTSHHLSWISSQVSAAASSAFQGLANAISENSHLGLWERSGEFGVGLSLVVEDEKKLVIELLPEVLPFIKDRIRESSIDGSDDDDEITAESARAPVAYAVVAAYQLRWFITKVDKPHLARLCGLIIPCGLTALDHWSSEVKGQGMISFVHIMNNINSVELGGYQNVILDACCQNIVCSDEIWHLAVEMSVLVITSTEKDNPRSPWFEKMLNEMLGHLERQPRNEDRWMSWLKLIDPVFYGVGLVLLAHFRRLFPLFFHWMHVGDDETILLVLKRIHTVLRLTWIRNSPYIDKLVNELTILYEEAAMRKAQEEIKTQIHHILELLQQCKGLQLEAAWEKCKADPNLGAPCQSIGGRNDATVTDSLLLL